MPRETAKWWPHKAQSTDARPRDGPPHRSDEASVMEGERRGWIIPLKTVTNQQWEESMESTKPFSISKQAVWKAYQEVKANHGAAGVDGESIEAYEAQLTDNLYKLWNRLASGSYSPLQLRWSRSPRRRAANACWVCPLSPTASHRQW